MAGRRADVLNIREVIRRLQLGERDRQIARDLQVSRKMVSKYLAWAAAQGLLSGPLPDVATLQAALAATLPIVRPPPMPSSVNRQGRVENTFFRYKSIIGDGLRARSPAGQGSEAVLGCEILNRMTALGRPVSYRIGR